MSVISAVLSLVRLATILEYSGISLNMENLGNSVQHRRKIVTNNIFYLLFVCLNIKKILFRTSNELSRALLTWSECGGDLFVGVYME